MTLVFDTIFLSPRVPPNCPFVQGFTKFKWSMPSRNSPGRIFTTRCVDFFCELPVRENMNHDHKSQGDLNVIDYTAAELHTLKCHPSYTFHQYVKQVWYSNFSSPNPSTSFLRPGGAKFTPHTRESENLPTRPPSQNQKNSLIKLPGVAPQSPRTNDGKPWGLAFFSHLASFFGNPESELIEKGFGIISAYM